MSGLRFIIHLFLFVFLLSTHAALAQPFSWNTIDLPRDVDINGIFTAGSAFIAFGDDGVILTTQTGTQWRDISLPEEVELFTGVSTDEHWFVAGPDAGIWVSSDLGANWAKVLLPEIENGPFRPFGIYLLANGQLLALGDEICSTRVAVSEDGVNWAVLSAQLNRAGASFPHPDGIVLTQSGLGPPCVVTPIIGGVLEFNRWNAETGFAGPIGITLSYFGAAAAWHLNRFWVTQRTGGLLGIPLEFWVGEFSSLDPVTMDERIGPLIAEPTSMAPYPNGLILSHIGQVTFLDLQANQLIEQTVPGADIAYRFAANEGVVVGVGNGGRAIWAVNNAATQPIDALSLGGLLLLVLLLLATGQAQVLSKRIV